MAEKKTTLTDWEKAEIIQLSESGKSISEIERITGISRFRIYKLFDEYGIERITHFNSRVCPVCGTKIIKGARFCYVCGKDVRKENIILAESLRKMMKTVTFMPENQRDFAQKTIIEAVEFLEKMK